MIRSYILETPSGIEQLLNSAVDPLVIRFWSDLPQAKRIYFVGCGTSYHAGLFAKHLMEKYLFLSCDVIDALEFVESVPDKMIDANTPVILLSHTGRSNVTIDACNKAQSNGAPTLALCGGLETPLAKVAHLSTSFMAIDETVGPKTKGYTLCLVALINLLVQAFPDKTLSLGQILKQLPEGLDQLVKELDTLVWSDSAPFGKVSEIVAIGGGICWSVVSEAALKLIEIARVNAVGYYTEHMRHGVSYCRTNQDGFVVVVSRIADMETAEQLSFIAEYIKAPILVIGPTEYVDQLNLSKRARTITLPGTKEEAVALESTIVLQLLACALAKRRGINLEEGIDPLLRFKTKV